MKYIIALMFYAMPFVASFAADNVVFSETSNLYRPQSDSQDVYIFPIKEQVNGSYPRDLNDVAVRSYNLWVFAVVPNSALLQTIPALTDVLLPVGVTTLRLDRSLGWVFFNETVNINVPLPPSRSFPADNNLLVMTPLVTRANLASLPLVLGLNRQIFEGTRILVTASDNPSADEGWRDVFNNQNYSSFDITTHIYNPNPDN